MIISVGMGWAIRTSFMMLGDWLELGIKKPQDRYGLGLFLLIMVKFLYRVVSLCPKSVSPDSRSSLSSGVRMITETLEVPFWI
jgi:hypothetical protein